MNIMSDGPATTLGASLSIDRDRGVALDDSIRQHSRERLHREFTNNLTWNLKVPYCKDGTKWFPI